MSLPSYIVRRQGSRNFYVRMPIPKDLQERLGTPGKPRRERWLFAQRGVTRLDVTWNSSFAGAADARYSGTRLTQRNHAGFNAANLIRSFVAAEIVRQPWRRVGLLMGRASQKDDRCELAA